MSTVRMCWAQTKQGETRNSFSKEEEEEEEEVFHGDRIEVVHGASMVAGPV